ncbi:hypothetical protein [Paenibacillus alkalitolerans]|uniref:hypothetical protein n=1 Tax=Paenibacillus alkalitolerans TaxID=2799335 RepID=UPI0018F2F816|nr:hypothetical protein [Paenibacillus alkalitolerans]
MEKPVFLFHGGSKLVDELKPNQAYDWGHNEGNQFAVYATSIKDHAIAFALGVVPDEHGNSSRVMHPKYGEPLKMIFVSGHPNYGGKGYVYKVSSEGFTYAGGNQWVNPNPVTPIEIIEINVDEHLHLFRYATEEEKAEIEEEYRRKTQRY